MYYRRLYFANSGLHTHLDLLNTGRAWWTLAVLLLIASLAKIVPVTLMSKLCTKKSWHYCSSIGVLMNTRGIVQLVVLNIGVELKVISPIIFAIFVLMATILTCITSPVLSLLYRREWEIEKLDMDRDAEELRTVSDECKNAAGSESHVQTISNGDISTDEQRRRSSGIIRQSSSSMPTHDTYLTVDVEPRLPQVNLDADGTQPAVLGNLVLMPTYSKRLLNMTRF